MSRRYHRPRIFLCLFYYFLSLSLSSVPRYTLFCFLFLCFCWARVLLRGLLSLCCLSPSIPSSRGASSRLKPPWQSDIFFFFLSLSYRPVAFLLLLFLILPLLYCFLLLSNRATLSQRYHNPSAGWPASCTDRRSRVSHPSVTSVQICALTALILSFVDVHYRPFLQHID